MSRKLRCLDLFAGAGGAGMGYHRAGFAVTGVDITAHSEYPFTAHTEDALEFLDRLDPGDFDLYHASPPCPRYSAATPAHRREDHPDLIGPVRDRLRGMGVLYVIENVPRAPLREPITLCGSMFGLPIRRHRLFESNIPMLAPSCQHHAQEIVYGVYGDHGDRVGAVPRPTGTSRGVKARDASHAGEVLGIDWVTEWHDLADAIPPAYTEFIARQAIEQIGGEAA